MNINHNWGNKTFSICRIPLFPLGSWLLIGWGWGEPLYGASSVSGHLLPKARSGAAAEGTLRRPQETLPSMLCLWPCLHPGIIPPSLHQIIKDSNADRIWESACESQSPHSQTTQRPLPRRGWAQHGRYRLACVEMCRGSIPRKSFPGPKCPASWDKRHRRNINCGFLFPICLLVISPSSYMVRTDSPCMFCWDCQIPLVCFACGNTKREVGRGRAMHSQPLCEVWEMNGYEKWLPHAHSRC